jgi:hypothetical protein
MGLTLRGGYLIKLCMKLIALISHDNYYSQFCHPFGSVEALTRQFSLFQTELTSCLNNFCSNLTTTCLLKIL